MPSNLDEKSKEQKSETNLQSIPSLSNLYNSHSNKGSFTDLTNSNSAVFNNGTGVVEKGTIAHINNTNTDQYDDDHDGGFELNWIPQVSSDNYTSGYHDKI
jgi:hypothetical protein